MKLKTSFKIGIGSLFVVFGIFSFSIQNIYAACLIDGDCVDADPCTYDACNVSSGICTNHKSCGGLVPCGRLVNNPSTLWNDKDACTICHSVPTIHNVIAYALSIMGILCILMLTLTVLASNMGMADAGQITTLKLGLNKAVQAFVLVLVAWLIVNLVMSLFGFIDPIGDGSWKKFNCNF